MSEITDPEHAPAAQLSALAVALATGPLAPEEAARLAFLAAAEAIAGLKDMPFTNYPAIVAQTPVVHAVLDATARFVAGVGEDLFRVVALVRSVEKGERTDEPRIRIATDEEPMTEHPTPCPFCGSTVVVVIEDLDGQHAYCRECGGRGPSRPSEAEAVDAWNRRPSVAPELDDP